MPSTLRRRPQFRKSYTEKKLQPLRSAPAPFLTGEARVPGDKSISHRALMIGASAVGETVITGLLEGADVRATASALSALGAAVERGNDGDWRVLGRGAGGLMEPETVLDLGNSGTGARLLAGLLATHPFASVLTGDGSLRSRPMARIIEPLSQTGAIFMARSGGRLPLAISGPEVAVPIDYRLPVPSAQVKSAILLAGLNAPGITTVVEPAPTRDHTERMLAGFGVPVETVPEGDNGRRVSITGQPEFAGRAISVPGDPSSAAFPTVAALVIPGSQIALPGVGVNPLRTGLYDVLREMGGQIEFRNPRESHGEPVADIVVTASALNGVRVPAAQAPRMIDEYPALAVAAACAKGQTRLEGLSELRVKESDRLAAIADGLAACGVKVETGEDYLVVDGCDGPPPGLEDGAVAAHGDHRIAMAFLTLGAAARRDVIVDDGRMIETSFPDFAGFMNGLGAKIA